MQVQKSLTAAIIITLLSLSVPAYAADEIVPVLKLQPAWTSKRMDATFWGITRGDVDGDGSNETVILEQTSLWIARVEGNSVTKSAEYKFPPYTQGLRVFAMNVDGRPGDEIIVSALAYDDPASFILNYDGSTFRVLNSKIPWHLRVLKRNGQNALVGQRSIPDEFFTGKLYELKWQDGKVVHSDVLHLPRNTRLFEFALAPSVDGKDILIQLKGYDKLLAYEERGEKRKWKRFWKSPSRFGGTLHYVELKSRPPMQDLPQYLIPIYKEPLLFDLSGATVLVAAQQDLPLKDIIMKKPLIEGADFFQFTYDEGLGFRERISSERLPGFVADYVVDRNPSTGSAQLFVAVQTDPAMFQPGTQSTIVIFNLPNP